MTVNLQAESLVNDVQTADVENESHRKETYQNMLHWSLIFLVIALIAGALGFGGIAGAAAGIAKLLFILFLIIWLVVFFTARRSI
jgi:uncharacterized membrane protein YtjA (UPF0391 family)